MNATCDIGLIGLAVMGQNLVLNMNDHGFNVVVFNRTTAKVDEFLATEGKNTHIVGAKTLPEFIAKLKKPRKIMFMVKAGEAVDELINTLLPLLEHGDIIIDGGNSHYPDSNRRTKMLEEKGLYFIATGISGGEEGARNGPSIMPGGSKAAWEHVKPIFQAISAKVDNSPCCEWVGNAGAGHFVKMVHNGIEYGDMQIICEAYHILKQYLGLPNAEIAQVFSDWNKGELNSYLIEITSNILGFKAKSGEELVDKILDAAGQKGTGKWTVEAGLNHGIPLTLISEAVFARSLSAIKAERVAASKILTGDSSTYKADKKELIEKIRRSVFCAKIVSYAQGFMLMKAASEEYNWNLDFGSVALMWRGGCIIRSQFLNLIKQAYDLNPKISNLMLAKYFANILNEYQNSWRTVIAQGIIAGIPLPAQSSALAFYDGYRSESLPANLLQAQRDYFGAHTYERTDKPRGEFFHTNWFS